MKIIFSINYVVEPINNKREYLQKHISLCRHSIIWCYHKDSRP